ERLTLFRYRAAFRSEGVVELVVLPLVGQAHVGEHGPLVRSLGAQVRPDLALGRRLELGIQRKHPRTCSGHRSSSSPPRDVEPSQPGHRDGAAIAVRHDGWMGTSSVPGPSSRTAPLCGIAATAVTLGVAELLAGLLVRLSGGSGTPSPLLAVGGAFVDRTPTWLKNWAVETFGTADKVALGVGIGVTLI